MQRRSLIALAFTCAANLLFVTSASAQKFPAKPITMIVPFAPGGNLDIVARTLAPALEKALGQPVIVENKAGAGGALGASFVARAEPDGHTLLVTTPNAMVVLPLISKTTYKLENFQSVGLAATTALVVVVKGNDARFKDMASLLSYARANPGKLAVGHAGPATTNHVALMLLEDAASLKLNLVPYKGSGPALVDLMGGQIDMVVDQATSSAPHIQSGALRAVAVMSREREPNMSAVPTLRESGITEFDATTSTGLLAPAGTPAAVIEQLNTALRKVLVDSAISTKLLSIGSVPRPSTAAEFLRLLQQEDARAQALAKAGKLKVE
jgi:tripartite-type tricarboxylate transporter receptor subunit TctC